MYRSWSTPNTDICLLQVCRSLGYDMADTISQEANAEVSSANDDCARHMLLYLVV